MTVEKLDDKKLDELYSFMLVYLHSKRKDIKKGGYKELINVLAEITAMMTKRFVEEEYDKRFTGEEAVKFISNLTRVLWETCDDKINDMED